jgi:hypothetical protein
MAIGYLVLMAIGYWLSVLMAIGATGSLVLSAIDAIGNWCYWLLVLLAIWC